MLYIWIYKWRATVCHDLNHCFSWIVLELANWYTCYFYCEQVSIAGQPGGVEAARVKIRVSWNSATFVLNVYSTQNFRYQTLIPCRLVSFVVLTFMENSACGKLEFLTVAVDFSTDQFLYNGKKVSKHHVIFLPDIWLPVPRFARMTLLNL